MTASATLEQLHDRLEAGETITRDELILLGLEIFFEEASEEWIKFGLLTRGEQDGEPNYTITDLGRRVQVWDNIMACTKCGTGEHVLLLDGKSATDDENGDFEAIECIACYGPGWCPTTGVEDFALSIVPAYEPLYDAWAARESAKVLDFSAPFLRESK